ncbi:MAG: hypothetical protein M3Z04_07290 [Chloroflexota bacterium]|nr:hypothetical protein [Chloroflexota bacterium]
MANGRVDSWDEDDAPAPRSPPAAPPPQATTALPAPPVDSADSADSAEEATEADEPPTRLFPTREQWRAAPPWVLLISCLSLGAICAMAMAVLLLIATLP